MRLTACVTLAMFAALTASPSWAEIRTAVADAEVGERPDEDRGGNGEELNTRFTNTDRNEIMVMRFDLSGINFNSFSNATLNLVHHRDNTSQRPYILYGVNDGAMGGDNNGETPGYNDNTWDEAEVMMSTMPGMIYDGDATTQGINPVDTTGLGSGVFSSSVKGDTETIDVEDLYSFLSTHPDELVTLVLARDSNNTSSGQDRFASKEAFELDGGTPAGSPGDFAPYLNFIPEPTSVCLMGLAGAMLLGIRRRAK